ncbi:MAG: hypothetical protein XD95_0389 [Microgenomates bacterium 39_7]|nr:MAG: hypothetical protein XD95_0389 [Microgenomates bacterium 39_7]
MNKLDSISNLPYFSVQSLATLFKTSSQVARITLSRWEKQDKVIRLKRGIYTSRQFVLKHRQQPYFYNLIANIIQPFSYLSLDYILQLHGILTEATYPITAITTKNTAKITNELGTFSYRHLKNQLYTGYQTDKAAEISYHWANKGKALFDFLYLRPLPRSKQVKSYNLVEDLRLNLADFTQDEVSQLADYAKLANSNKMDFIINHLKKTVWHDL